MTKIISLVCNPENAEETCIQIAEAIQEGFWVELTTREKTLTSIDARLLPKGPGILLKSGGSTNKPRQCLLPYDHLNQSALATKKWLQAQRIDTNTCMIVNALPINHVSGFMPWWRSRCWNAKHLFIKPSIMRDAKNLALFGHSIEAELVKITSLVPTQLNRLITTTEGISWLRSFAVIWVGGAPISTGLLKKAKDEGIRLSPCYGATETTAMVTAQNPNNFLKGEVSLGAPLNDVELRLGKRNRLQIRTKRLAVGTWKDGHFEKITEKNSWWDSGDIAELFKINDVEHLKIIGRVDTAIHSGGETIYPEYLRARLLDITNKTDLPIKTIILTAIEDEEWGSRLVALLRLQENTNEKEANNIIRSVQKLICDWPAHEKPRIWYNCPELETNDFGKWEFEKWRTWIKEKSADNSN